MSMHYYPQTDLNQQNLDWVIQTLKDLQTQVNNGGIKVVTLAANMTDHNVIYVYEGTEVGMNTDHWYYFDNLNQVWVDGGGWGGGAITLPLVIADGGTGATSAAQARTNLGLGSLALENNPLSPSKGGTGQTSLQSTRNAMGLGNTTGALPVANGGTGQTTVAAARNAFGLGNTTGPVPIANGGTGSATAAAALTALGAEPAITALPISKGGTGSQTAAAARTALGITPTNIGAVGSDEVIDIAHGGTGAASASAARAALGFAGLIGTELLGVAASSNADFAISSYDRGFFVLTGATANQQDIMIFNCNSIGTVTLKTLNASSVFTYTSSTNNINIANGGGTYAYVLKFKF